MKNKIERRQVLRMGALGAGLIGTGSLSVLLEACGSSSKTASSATTVGGASGSSAGSVAPGTYGTISVQLSWIENDEFSGEYLADTRGYYTKEGFSAVNLLAGGPNITAAAINQGADLVIVGAEYQKNPFAIMSLASSPIPNPQAMIGKKIGVQSTNQAVWNSFLKANKIDASKIDVVPVQFDPTPLTTHSVDGWFSFFTNEPNLLKVKGIDTHTFLLNDYNYPLVSETFMVQRSALTGQNREKLKAFLRAEIMGWHDSIADPTAGPHLVVTKYGKTLGLEEKEQTLESRAQNTLILTPDSQANGLFTLTPEVIDRSISTLALGGIKITADKLFDTSVINEVYSETPSLKASPAMGSASTSTTPTS